MDLSKKTRNELIDLCKGCGLTGYSNKNKDTLMQMLMAKSENKSDLDLGPEGIPVNTFVSTRLPSYKLLSLFSGMGGMDLGFAEQVIVHKNSISDDFVDSPYSIDGFVNLKRLPFEVVFQNDILPEAKKLAELNNWNHNYTFKDVRDLLKDNYVFPQADVITGGFPCQDFSHAGKRQGFDSTRGTLYQSYVEIVKQVKPIVFIAENVNGLLTMPGEPIKQIVADFSEAGYEVKYQLIKSEEFKIPQTRWRVIIMGVRLDMRPKLGPDWNLITENRGFCPIRPYFAHLLEPEQSTDPAQKAYSRAARLDKGQGQKEVALDECAPTMRAEHHGNIEFRRLTGGKNKENLPQRRLTVREAALIQTFPPDCILSENGKITSMGYKPVGNAVPPLLGYLIARKVKEILDAVKQ